MLFPKRCTFCNDVIGFLSKCEKCEEEKNVYYLENQKIDKSIINAPYIETAYAVFIYDSLIKNSIIRMKFEDAILNAKDFALEMSVLLDTCNLTTKFDIIVPVPLHKKRLLWRGYNVSAMLAKHLSAITKTPLNLQDLIKTYETVPQANLASKQRKANLIGAFSVKNKNEFLNKNVLLVDDVITTGSTLNECAKALLIAGAKTVTSICVAQSSPNIDRKY